MMGNGVLNPNYVDDCNSPRPAPTLNPSSILFSSQAVGGKATEVGKTLSENSTSGHEWKLTVLDSNRKLKIDFGSIERIGNEISLLFSEAAIGENSYVSAVVKGADGSIKYYGKVANTSTKADGVVNLDISILSEGEISYIFLVNKLMEINPQTTQENYKKLRYLKSLIRSMVMRLLKQNNDGIR